MLRVIDKTAECALNPWRNIDGRDPRIAEFILIHRNEVASTPEALADFFVNPKNGTGGRFPYHFFINKAGEVFQCAPLSVATPGARGANRSSIQIVLDGDFRKVPPTPEQSASLDVLCGDLLRWKPSLKVQGHTDVANRSADPKKVCPGVKLPTGPLRIAVLERLERDAKDGLRSSGVKF